MANVSPQSVTLAARGQVVLERYKQGVIDDIAKILLEADRVIRLKLSGEQTAWSRARLEAQLNGIRAELSAIYAKAGSRIMEGAKDAGPIQAVQQANAIQAVVIDKVELAVPSPDQIFAAATARPMKLGKTAQMLKPFVDKWATGSVDAAENIIRLGALTGRTNAQIVQDLRGTKAARYQDGVIGASYKNAMAVTRTAVQHVATVARMETMAKNADIVTGYQWVSVLDDRTTDICRSLSGQTFKIGEGPLPPQHFGCRSSVVGVLDKRFDFLKQGATQASKGADGGAQVNANLTYYEWLKTQPAEFQDTAIGPMRGALLRNGGISADRFAELNLGKNFEPLTLKEMAALEPVAFDRAGIEITEGGRAVWKK